MEVVTCYVKFMSLYKKFWNIASDSQGQKTSFKSWKGTCIKLIWCGATYFVEVSVKIFLSNHVSTFENIAPSIQIKFAGF